MTGGSQRLSIPKGACGELIEERMDPDNDALVATNRPKTKVGGS